MPVYITRDNPEKERLIKKALLLWRPSIDMEKIIFLPGGSSSVAVRAGVFVCRFPQTAEALAAIRIEAELTGILNKNLSEASRRKMAEVSIAENSDENVLSFSYHRYIKGKIMDNIRGETEFNTCYARLNPKQKRRLALEIALFFIDLHTLPITLFQRTSLSENRQDWDFTRKINKEKSRNLLLKHSDGKLDLNEFKTEVSDDIVFCHNDLSGSNLLIDLNDENILKGVIDFGNSGLFPRTNEFIPLYKIGRELVVQTVGFYNQYSRKPVSMREIDYKFLCFVCFLLEQQKKPSFFTTALIKDFVQSYFNIRT